MKGTVLPLLQYQVPFNDSNELKTLETDLAYIHTNLYFLSLSGAKMEQKTNKNNKRDQQRSR
jgi:hypothetical protein